MKGPTTTSHYRRTITRHVNEQQNNRVNVVAERKVPRVGQTNRPHFGFLQIGKRLPHRQHLASDSSGIQHVEQVVAEEQKPRGHLQTQKLDDVEHVARHLHQGPAIPLSATPRIYLSTMRRTDHDCCAAGQRLAYPQTSMTRENTTS